MPHKRKKFINKKNAVTFALVHRGQKDPLRADETAPRHVLVEKRTGRVLALDAADDSRRSVEHRREEQRKYGVYFDDDYNYLQHLRDVDAVMEPVVDRFRIVDEPQRPSIRLPSSVFRSAVEEREGLLHRAAPQRGPRPDWDPDVVRALDEDFDFDARENLLEDDFVTLAEGRPDDGEDDGSGYESSDEARSSADEEVRSRFTNYTLSSAAIPRGDGLRTLDDLFERVLETYDDLELGALDGEEVGGILQPEILTSLVAEHERRLPTLREVGKETGTPVESRPTYEETVNLEVGDGDSREKWDCESILSTYSNLCNRPKLIVEPRKAKIVLSRRSGVPVGPRKGDVHRLDTASTTSAASSARPRNETADERRLRKALVRSQRRERRMEKKENSLAFKAEERRQERALIGLRNNLNAVKLA